jgi:hypothetical protein
MGSMGSMGNKGNIGNCIPIGGGGRTEASKGTNLKAKFKTKLKIVKTKIEKIYLLVAVVN